MNRTAFHMMSARAALVAFAFCDTTASADYCLDMPNTVTAASTSGSNVGNGLVCSDSFATMTTGGEMSFSFWIRNPEAKGDRRSASSYDCGYVIGNGCYSGQAKGFALTYECGTAGYKQFVLQVRTDNDYSFAYPTGGTSGTADCGVADGAWHHVVVTYSYANGRCRGYIDGTLVNEDTTSTFLKPTATSICNLTIGRHAIYGGWCLSARLARVSAWSRELTADDVALLYAGEPDASATGLEGYWKLNDGAGSTAADSSSGGHGMTVKSGSSAAAGYWRSDGFAGYSMTGYEGVADGASHSCSFTAPAGAATAWAWSGDPTDFSHDGPEAISAAGIYTNICRMTKNGLSTYATGVVKLTMPLYVAPDGSDTAAGTAAAPLATIAKALETLGADGGTIYVKDGTYQPSSMSSSYTTTIGGSAATFTCGICVLVTNAVEIVGLSGDPSKVVIDAQSSAMTMMLDNSGAAVRNVTLANGTAVQTSGAVGGGNMQIVHGSVENCIFRDGVCTSTGSNLMLRDGRASRCVFVGGGFAGSNSTSSDASAYAIGRTASLDNCLVTGYESAQSSSVALAGTGGASFYNCTLASNSVVRGAAAVIQPKSSLSADAYFVNCAFFDNGAEVYDGGGTVESHFRYCASSAAWNAAYTTCIHTNTADAGFKSVARGDWRPESASSPLATSGSVAAYVCDTALDLAGRARIKAGTISIGAYQYLSNERTMLYMR